MALENIQTEAPEANESTEMSAIAPNALDLSGVDSPFSTLNGLNLTNIENENKLLNPAATVTETASTETGPGDPVKKTLTMDQIRSLSKKERALTQIESKNTGYLVSQSRSLYKAFGDYEFDRYKSNVDRYRGYGRSTFRELGFNPMEDNETHYNDNTGTWREWYRMSGQFMSLANTAFFSNYESIGNLLSGGDLLSGDEEANRQFAEANRLGGSSKGGFTGFVNNLALNSAYSIGIAANIVAEETAIWAIGILGAPETGGASLVGAGALQVEEGVKIAANLGRLKKALSMSFGGGEIAKMFKSTGMMLKSLSRVDDARGFYAGAKGFAIAAGKTLNPFRQTTQAIKGIVRGTEEYRNLTNAAKIARGFGSFYRDTRENWFAVSESQLEGGGTTQDLIDTYIDQYTKDPKNEGKLPTGKALRDIYANAYAAGRVDVLGNIPLIFLTNRVTLDGLFKFKGVKSLIELAEQTKPIFGKRFTLDVAGKGFAETAKEGLYKTFIGNIKNPKKWVGGMLSYTKHNLSEGIQELGQEWLADATRRYYMNIYSNPNIAQSDLLKTSLYSEFLNTGKVTFSKESAQAFKAKVLSPEGISTFASGFLMGGLIGGSKFGLSAIGNKIWNTSAELYMKKNSPDKFAQYIKNKEEFREKHIAILNSMLSDAETLFSRKKESLVNQINGNNNMDAADENEDDLLFYDHKDDKTFDHIFQSLDSQTFGSLIDGFKELQKLTDDELADYFNNDNGAKSREKLGEYIDRANEIKNRYDKVQEQFKNPFRPHKFEKGSEDQISEFIAYRAFEDAKKTAIASQYGFDRALQRMNSILADLSKDKPLSKSSQSDFSVLFDPKTMAVEIELLKDEADLLSQSEKSADKQLAKKKLRRSEALAEYLEKYNDYVANKSKTVLNTATGEFTVDSMAEWMAPLEKAYNKYLKSVADINDDAVFTNNVSNSFKKIVDYYNLKDDSMKYMDVVNHLSNPNNLVRHANRINLILNDLYENRTKLAGEAIDMHLNNMELNHMIISVAMLGVVIDPQQLIQFAKTGKYPRTFYDIKNNKLIDKNDPRFDIIFEKLDTFKQLTSAATNRVTISAEEVEAKRLEEEKAAQAKLDEEERKKKEEETKRKTAALPTEIKDKIQKAYDDFVAETGSDMTLEEFERDHPAAASIKASAPATTSTTTSTEDLGFQNLGNIGNQGLAVMEADILKIGRHVISGISKATPEQRKKIDEDVEELKKKYPEKTFVVQTLGDKLTIDVVTTPAPAAPLTEIEKLEKERDEKLEKNANRYKDELAKLKEIAAKEVERTGLVQKVTSDRISGYEGLIASEKFRIEDEYKAKIDALKGTVSTDTKTDQNGVEIVSSQEKLVNQNQILQSPSGKFGVLSGKDDKTIIFSNTLEEAVKVATIEKERKEEINSAGDVESWETKDKYDAFIDKINNKYDDKIDALGGKPAQQRGYYGIPVEGEVTIPIQNGKMTLVIANREDFQEEYVYEVKDGKVVSGTHHVKYGETYKGGLKGTETTEAVPEPLEKFRRQMLSESKLANGKTQKDTLTFKEVDPNAEAIAKIYGFYNQAYQMQQELAERGRELDPDYEPNYVDVLKDPIAYLQKQISNFKKILVDNKLKDLEKSKEELLNKEADFKRKEDFEKELKTIEEKIKEEKKYIEGVNRAITENEQFIKDINALKGGAKPTASTTTATTSTESKNLEAEKQKITADEFKEVVRLAKFFLENPSEPGVSGSVRFRYPNLYNAIFEIEQNRKESLNSIEERYDKGLDLDTGRATITKADGTTEVISDLKDVVTSGDPFKRLKDKINEAYDAERKTLGGKAAEPVEVVIPVATVPIQNGRIYIEVDSTESYSKSYTFRVENGEIVNGTVDTYFQGEYRDTKTSDPLPDPKATFNEVSANERLKDKFKITEVLTPEQELSRILDAITSLKEVPSLKLNDTTSEITNKLLDLIRSRKATSEQVIEALTNKRNEMLKNLTLSDFVKGDIVTFTNGEKGIVSSTNKAEQRVRIKVFGTKAGETRAVNMKDVPSQIKSIDNPKDAMEQEVEKVAVTPDMQKKSEEGKQNMDSVMSNDAKMKEAFTNGMNTNSKDAENDFLNNIIC